MFAVIETGGKQYRVAPGDIIKIEKIDRQAGENIVFEEVLLFSDNEKLEIGKPSLAMQVEAKILKHGKSDKINVIKFHAKKRYQRKQGHRQEFSEIEIIKIAPEDGKSKVSPKEITTEKEVAEKSSTINSAKKEDTV